MNNRQKVLNLLGLAMKAGKVTSGESFSLMEVQSNRAKIVFVANDASENTKKKFLDKCNYYSVPVFFTFSKEEISQSIGKSRTICSISDKGFSAKLQELLSK